MDIVPIGRQRYAQRVVAWSPRKSPHGLVVGPTGSGKSCLLRLVAVRAAAVAEVVILDGKAGGDYCPLIGCERVAVLRGPVAVDKGLADVENELDQRLENGETLTVPRIVILDELAALAIPYRGEAPKDTRIRVERLRSTLQRVVFLGRAAQIHLWVGTQRGDVSDALPGAVRDQLNARIALGGISPEASRMTFGVQVQRLDVRPGNGWATGLDGIPDGGIVPIVVDEGSEILMNGGGPR